MTESLDARIAELERLAGRLKAGEAEDEEAAALVDRCAALASEIATELDRLGREPPAEARESGAAGQESLL